MIQQARRRSFQEDQKSKALAEASYLIKTFPKTVIEKAAEFLERPETSLESVAFLETSVKHRNFRIDNTKTLEMVLDAVTEMHALGCARNNFWWYTSVKAPSTCVDFIQRDEMLKGAFDAFKLSLEWSKKLLPPIFKWRIVIDLASTYVRRRDFETAIRLLTPVFERDDMNNELQEVDEDEDDDDDKRKHLDLPLRSGVYTKKVMWNKKDIASADRFRAGLILAVSLRMMKRFRESAAYWQWLLVKIHHQFDNKKNKNHIVNGTTSSLVGCCAYISDLRKCWNEGELYFQLGRTYEMCSVLLSKNQQQQQQELDSAKLSSAAFDQSRRKLIVKLSKITKDPQLATNTWLENSATWRDRCRTYIRSQMPLLVSDNLSRTIRIDSCIKKKDEDEEDERLAKVASDWQLLIRMLLASGHIQDAKRAASNGFSAACEAARREDKAAAMWMSLMSSEEIRTRECAARLLQRVWRGCHVRSLPGIHEWRAMVKYQRSAHKVQMRWRMSRARATLKQMLLERVKRHFDEGDGRWYYENTKDGEISWKRPFPILIHRLGGARNLFPVSKKDNEALNRWRAKQDEKHGIVRNNKKKTKKKVTEKRWSLVKTVGRFVTDLRHAVNRARNSMNENLIGPSVNGLVKEMEEDEEFEKELEASIQRRLVVAANGGDNSIPRSRMEYARALDGNINKRRVSNSSSESNSSSSSRTSRGGDESYLSMD